MSKENENKPLKQPIVSGSYDMNKLSKLIKEIYMQGYYDRDWKISEDSADEIAETLSVKKILDRCKA